MRKRLIFFYWQISERSIGNGKWIFNQHEDHLSSRCIRNINSGKITRAFSFKNLFVFAQCNRLAIRLVRQK